MRDDKPADDEEYFYAEKRVRKQEAGSTGHKVSARALGEVRVDVIQHDAHGRQAAKAIDETKSRPVFPHVTTDYKLLGASATAPGRVIYASVGKVPRMRQRNYRAR